MDREAMLALVERSPAAVAAQDGEAWLSLFAQLAVIEDPVGSRPHIGGVFDARSGRRANDALARFYATFIEGNHIEFVRGSDHVMGNVVVRDLALQLEVAGMRATVPMHLMYELVFEDGALKIRSLQAHWEMLPVTVQMLRSRPAGMLAYSAKLLRGLGLSGVLGFARALRSVGNGGKQRLLRFIEVANAGGSFDGMFDDAARGVRFPGSDGWVTPAALGELGVNMTPNKLIAAGNRVSCSLQVGQAGQAGQTRAGVAIAEFNRRSGRLDNVTLIV
ncbi:MAG: hypothetical protein R3228_07925 [Halioglobus sp.]|nr:hypothetical protein [Halioglobus sp.]